MTGFSLKVTGLDRLQKVFYQLPVRARKELKAELKVTASEVRDAAKSEAPADEARLKQSISFKENGALGFNVVAQTAYAGYLEFGTKSKAVIPAGLQDIANQLKGPAPGQGNPLEALQKWVKRKGIAGIYSVKTRKVSNSKASLANIKQVAFLIWRHIRKFGIKPQPYFFKQVPPAEQKLKTRLANFIKRII
jgi:HK97 gp10 family phage protein